MHANLKAFLDMIAVSEIGRELIRKSDNGYNVIVGSTPAAPMLMADYRDHPRRLVKLRIGGDYVTSSAAGRYQILARYFDAYKKQLALPDFGKASQDAIAIQLIKECRAIDMIQSGHFSDAVLACRSRWASLPGAGYSQPEHTMAYLQTAYKEAGGLVA